MEVEEIERVEVEVGLSARRLLVEGLLSLRSEDDMIARKNRSVVWRIQDGVAGASARFALCYPRSRGQLDASNGNLLLFGP